MPQTRQCDVAPPLWRSVVSVPREEQPHEWISFEDPDELRTWMIDATFLRSSYKCIYGQGCQGVHDDPTPELMQGCCSFGAHFLDEKDLKSVKKYVKRLSSKHWKNKSKAKDKGWFSTNKDGESKTRVVNGACIFHNPPGFEGGTGCAFHIAAEEAGERHMDWKPDVCWQVPVRLEEHVEDGGYVVSTIREWKRRDWGEGGDDFHWWCTESSDSFVGKDPTYTFFSDELTEIMGKKSYAILVKMLSAPVGVPLPHPALRKKV
jgi:hypothetical protein